MHLGVSRVHYSSDQMWNSSFWHQTLLSKDYRSVVFSVSWLILVNDQWTRSTILFHVLSTDSIMSFFHTKFFYFRFTHFFWDSYYPQLLSFSRHPWSHQRLPKYLVRPAHVGVQFPSPPTSLSFSSGGDSR